MLSKTLEKMVEVRLTTEEKKTIAEKLARRVEEKKRLEDEKKALVSELTAKVNDATAHINALAGMLTTGVEMRLIECDVEYNLVAKQKIIVNPIDGKTVDRLKLEPWEIEELSQPNLPGL